MGPPPIVTGISPKEGPPGTRVTIRGEYLGREQNDMIGMSEFIHIECIQYQELTNVYLLDDLTRFVDLWLRLFTLCRMEIHQQDHRSFRSW